MYDDTRPGLSILGGAWRIVRLPIVTVLLILEPVVSLVFGGLALLGILMTIFYKAIAFPGFPTWTMLGISIGFGLVLSLYRALIIVLSR